MVALGERDCSAQRRNQKVIEETPAPDLPDATRAALCETRAPSRRDGELPSRAGTVEFVYDATTSEFYFLEVNTRLQVEHGVTEEVTGVDLVEWMVRQAAGELPPLDQASIKPSGASIQVRLYAEDPGQRLPARAPACSPSGVARGRARRDLGRDAAPRSRRSTIPMLAKIIVHGATRDEALASCQAALERDRDRRASRPTSTTCAQLSRRDVLARGEMLTRARLQDVAYQAATIDVARPRHADHGAGLAGPRRLLGRRRAAVGADGCARVPARQPARRQRRGRRRPRDHARRPDAALQQRRGRLPRRRRAHARRSTASRCRTGKRLPSTPGRC